MAKSLVFALAGLSLLTLQSCSLFDYAMSGEPIPNDYVGRRTIEFNNYERETREWGYWLQDLNEGAEGRY